jgi:predicted TIM-barrel fold metal-dependent hydrolase
MKAGRFVVDAHVHAQRFAPAPELAEKRKQAKAIRYNDLGAAISTAEPYDNSDRLLYDMECYRVDMCVLLPAFGMTNELNLDIVSRHPDKFVAVCMPSKTRRRTGESGERWDAKVAAAELDQLLSTGRFVGIGEGLPAEHGRSNTISQTERLDQMRPTMEVARKHKTVVQVHSGVVMGYPLTHHYWPETLHPMWILDIAQEYPDVPIVLNHGGIQGGRWEHFFEEALLVAGANDSVYLETGLWWSELYEKALRDPNVGAEKLLWGCDWGASIPFHSQLGERPGAFAVQLRKQPLVSHQIDVWGWSLRELRRLDISQDDVNLILGGNAARLYNLPVPHKRLFRPVGPELVPQPGEMRGAKGTGTGA